ncbi:MAG: hypothetical protein DMF64_06680 [Acidobacteria bacterium]|nr:MAG: hypothetical protein DMF64_06680 [Acidobacteriota bacterium]
MTTLEMQQLMDFILAQRVQFMITMRRVEENQAQMAQLQMRLSNTMRQLTEAQTRAAVRIIEAQRGWRKHRHARTSSLRHWLILWLTRIKSWTRS